MNKSIHNHIHHYTQQASVISKTIEINIYGKPNEYVVIYIYSTVDSHFIRK